MSAVRRVSSRAAARTARDRISTALSAGDSADSDADGAGAAPNNPEPPTGAGASRKRSRGPGDGEAHEIAPDPVPEGQRAPLPERNARGQLVFPDQPRFRPTLTPKQVLQAGAFGGGYFRPIYSSVIGEQCVSPPPLRFSTHTPHAATAHFSPARAARAAWRGTGASFLRTGSRGSACPGRSPPRATTRRRTDTACPAGKGWKRGSRAGGSSPRCGRAR